MFEETIQGANESVASNYTRLESEDWDAIKGKRINGHGKISGLTNAEGEHHPAVIKTEDGALFTPEELKFADFDGRHGILDF